MRYFQRIADGVDVFPLLHAIQRQPELWNAHTIRTQHPGTAHSEVSDILVRFNDLANPELVPNDREAVAFPAWEKLPQLRPIIFDLMRRVEAVQLGRVIITRLPPGKTISPHVDGGAPATWYTRFQICLQATPGNLFHAGNETVSFRSGEVWSFDNQQTHSVENFGKDDRIVVIVDARCE
jgi:hypothetical protein